MRSDLSSQAPSPNARATLRWMCALAAATGAALLGAAPVFGAGEAKLVNPADMSPVAVPTAADIVSAVAEAVPVAPTTVPAATQAPPPSSEHADAVEPQSAPPSAQAATPAPSESADGHETDAAASAPDAGSDGSRDATGGSTGTGGSVGTGQQATTGQAAGASATTIQIAPTNIAIPILIGSSAIINQTNTAGASASASNTNTVIQVATGAQGTGPPATTGSAGPTAGTLSGVLDPIITQSGASISVVLNWNWTWNWNWNWNWEVPWNPGQIGLPSSATSGPGAGAGKPTSRDGAVRHVGPGATDDGARLSASQAPRVNASSGGGGNASSSIVQIPARRPLLPSAGHDPAPAPGGSGGISPLTLLIGALVALLLQLSSAAGLLGRRLRLAGAGWRRQAYLAPLQRPG